MALQESHSYPLVRPFSFSDIASYNGANEGLIRKGPDNRAFVVSMFHQLHCMTNFRHAFLKNSQLAASGAAHMGHCLKYIRQEIMCKADLTLEDYDFMSANFSEPEMRRHKPRTCKNYEQLLNEVEINFLNWLKEMRAEVCFCYFSPSVCTTLH